MDRVTRVLGPSIKILGTIVVCIAGLGCSMQSAGDSQVEVTGRDGRGASIQDQPGSPSAPNLTCLGEERDSWLAEWRERFLRGDQLALSAVQLLGAPSTCDAEITSTFDGAKFGALKFVFKDGSALAVETSPPETSRVRLTLVNGFRDEEEGRRLLYRYVESVGLTIDWAVPNERDEDGKRVLTYWADEEGLNAAASLVYAGNRLVEISLSMAL